MLEFLLRFMNMKQKLGEEKNTKKKTGCGRFVNMKKKLRRKEYQKEDWSFIDNKISLTQFFFRAP